MGFFDDDEDDENKNGAPLKDGKDGVKTQGNDTLPVMPLPKLNLPVDPLPKLGSTGNNSALPPMGGNQFQSPSNTQQSVNPAPVERPAYVAPVQPIPAEQKPTPVESRPAFVAPPQAAERTAVTNPAPYVPAPQEPTPVAETPYTPSYHSQQTHELPLEPTLQNPTPIPPKQRNISISDMTKNFQEKPTQPNVEEALGLGQQIKQIDLGESDFGELSDDILLGKKKDNSNNSDKKYDRRERPEKIRGKGFAKGNRNKNAIDNAGPKSIDPAPDKINQTPKAVLFTRFLFGGFIVVMVALGAKSAFFPETFPSPERVIGIVKEGIGLTEFPTEGANALVLDFTKTYLNVDSTPAATTAMSTRDGLLESMVAAGVDLGTVTSDEAKPVKVSIVSGPYITSVTNVDNNNAQYDVVSKLSTGNWVKLRVPVFYNDKTYQFIVSSAPTFLETPQLAPDTEKFDTVVDWTTSDDSIEQIQPDLEGYFKAWGASKSDVLLRYLTPEPSRDASFGLNGALVFKDIETIMTRHPFTLETGEPDMTRKAVRVTVNWNMPNNASTTFVQSYDLLMIKDQDKWYVNDLRSGQSIYSTTDTTK